MKASTPNKHNQLLTAARKLRQNMTSQERHLWYDYLRFHSQKFYKQRIICCFIVDFYCPAAKLIIELDGSQHYTEQGEAYDRERTAILEQNGFFVLRFSNLDIVHNFHGVCEIIDQNVTHRLGAQ